jgi:hypothetical protein
LASDPGAFKSRRAKGLLQVGNAAFDAASLAGRERHAALGSKRVGHSQEKNGYLMMSLHSPQIAYLFQALRKTALVPEFPEQPEAIPA